jgi:hypothetical protein
MDAIDQVGSNEREAAKRLSPVLVIKGLLWDLVQGGARTHVVLGHTCFCCHQERDMFTQDEHFGHRLRFSRKT